MFKSRSSDHVNEMNYRHLSLQCECGAIPQQIAEVGFTDDRELVIHWWCDTCRRIVYFSRPLSECWRDCLALDHLEHVMREAARVAHEEADERFLNSIGICSINECQEKRPSPGESAGRKRLA